MVRGRCHLFADSGRSSRRRARVLGVLLALCAGLMCYILSGEDRNANSAVQRFAREAHAHDRATLKLEFPDEYHATGVLSLPYGDIKEPFEVWYSGLHGMSRIDYYGGMDRTYQRGDLGKYGYACKIVPEFSERTGRTFKGCLHRRGNSNFQIKAQSIIPSPKFFKFKGHEDFRGNNCAKWEHSFNIYNKVNTYTLYTTPSRPYTPVRYEMMGYDTLLSSYYDHYILDYHNFSAWKYQYSVFEIPTDIKCFEFSHEKNVGAVGEINPMFEFMPHTAVQQSPQTLPTPTHTTSRIDPEITSEESLEYLLQELNKMPFVSSDDTSVESSNLLSTNQTSGVGMSPPNKNNSKTSKMNDWLQFRPQTSPRTTRPRTRSTTSSQALLDGTSYQSALRHYEDIVSHLFNTFKASYRKRYPSAHEHERRKDIYRHNMRFIKSRNRQHLGYSLKPNHMADMTDAEVNRMKGLLHEEPPLIGDSPFSIPDKDRGVPLPPHVDWRKAGAVNSVKSQGICGSCYAFAVAGALEGAHFIKTGLKLDLSEQQIVDCTWGFGNRGCKGGYPYRAMQWILKHGGLATEESYGRYLAQEGYCHFKNTSIGARLDKYMSIRKGNTSQLKLAVAFYGPVSILVNTQPKTFKFYGSGIYYDTQCTHALDHAALAVGYGEEKGVSYWIVKNSWSAMWGEEGYIKIAMKDDNCGVAQKAVVVDVKT
ncbi:uncharacterized protein LOC5516093 [Nematostella vectensis]|uniref:uncharacterized protein LOC5516093 n=1 Tax=Nematostella vectensis TaxID=45351 RepID=UPI0020773A8C|nr:uncharacterized protein LOC5516093 [Nematostella vectensis]